MASVLSTQAPAVAIRDLRKRFGPLEVLKGVSMSAADGEVISILGASGSGKSTMLRCINMLEVPDGGEVAIGGETIALEKDRRGRMRPADGGQVDRIRMKVAMVFQSFNLWSHMTVLENVVEAPVHVQKRPRAEAVAEAEALLAKVGIADKRDHYPSHLSGGQQQRAAIVRAIATDPEVLFLDEITSALDPELVGEVLELVRQLAADGATILMATHEMAFARDVAHRVVFLDAGTIVEQGPPSEVLAAPREPRTREFLARFTA